MVNLARLESEPCFKRKDASSYPMCWCSGAGVAILVKPKSAGSSAALRVVGHSGWFLMLNIQYNRCMYIHLIDTGYSVCVHCPATAAVSSCRYRNM